MEHVTPQRSRTWSAGGVVWSERRPNVFDSLLWLTKKATGRCGSCHSRLLCMCSERSRRSVTLETERGSVDGQVLIGHRANRGFICHKPCKLVPILIAPFLSRFSGVMQSRSVQRRKPRIVRFIARSISFHGAHCPRQMQQVFDV